MNTTTVTTNMNSPNLVPVTNPSPAAQAGQPAERHDIHKSCRTIEVLVSALTDYCETASTLASLQKKVGKALKDAAAIKGSVEYAANALNATAAIFDVLAEVDTKFAKIAVKECAGMSAEVKKWFKKLAKEEKAHDERMNVSNAKIKQAGQSYERKSKKGSRDASEEHERYINLLSVLGPEMSQSKHNHAVFVAQKHASTVFCVASCLARIADAEWARTCESMRRFAPTIGPLGEWRALCEGAWSGPLPADLPDADMLSTHNYNLSPTATMTTAVGSTIHSPAVSEWGLTGTSPLISPRSLPIPPGGLTSSSAPFDPPRLSYASSSTNSRTSATTNDSFNSSENQGSIHSVTTLSAFPLPPAHIPVPASAPPTTDAEALRWQHEQHQMQLQNIHAALSHMEIQNQVQTPSQFGHNQHPLSESPPAMENTLIADSTQGVSEPPKSPRLPTSLSQTPSVSPHSEFFPTDSPGSSSGSKVMVNSDGGEPRRARRRSIVRPPLPSPAPTAPLPLPPTLIVPTPASVFRPESPFKREFGMRNDANGEITGNGGMVSGETGRSNRSTFKSQSVDVSRKALDRSDSTGSNVAALRNRYSRIVDPPAPGPRDIPRLPMSVVEIASKYRPVDEPMSPRRTVMSPTTDRFPPFPDTPMHQMTRDLQSNAGAISGEMPKGPRNSPFLHKRGSQSVSHIVLPNPSSFPIPANNMFPTAATASSSQLPLRMPKPLPSPANKGSHPPSRSQNSTPLPAKDHAPFCGCQTCSASKYGIPNTSSSPHDFRPPEPPIMLRPEKSKGWIRRLSMPSMNGAFSLDAAKRNAASLANLAQALPVPVGEEGRLRKRSFEQNVVGVGQR